MSRLRIGDIEIDGRSVTIRKPRPGPHTPAPRKRALDQEALRFLRRVPLTARTLISTGVILICGGVVLTASVLFSVSAVGWLIGGGLLLSIGAGAAVSGLAM